MQFVIFPPPSVIITLFIFMTVFGITAVSRREINGSDGKYSWCTPNWLCERHEFRLHMQNSLFFPLCLMLVRSDL